MLLGETALVLEGGGMRGVFTSGVLDAFMKYDIHFPYCVAVSAGACNGLSYASWQPRRAHYTNVDMLEEYRYIGIKHLIKQRSIFDPDLLYDKAPNEIKPYDYDAYFNSGMLFEQVVTNCQTGLAEYLSETNGDRKRLIDICHASSSLPFVSPIMTVDGKKYLDGGIVDSIPLQRAYDSGYDKAIVVLTRNRGYRKTGRDIKMPHFVYKKYPRLKVALSHRLRVYNEQLSMVERLEDEGRIQVIRPEKPLEVDRLEKNVQKLEALYQEGLRIGEQFCLTLAR